jgi:anti-sigma factor RsiW
VRRDTSPIDLEDVSAYLDGELDEARCAAVESHLADHPEAAARLAEYRRRDEALRLVFARLSADQAKHPMPRVTQARSPGKRRFRLAIAATVLGMTLGTTGWWYGSTILENRALAILAHEAVTAHLLYARQPEQSSLVIEDSEHVSARLSAVLGAEVKAPNLSTLGLQLVGLRELPSDGGPAALLVYQDADGREVSCYFKHLAENHETGFTRMAAARTNVIYRLDEHLGYAVVGPLPMSALQRIAEASYRQNSGERQ